MTDPSCALCQLAAMPIEQRPTKTLYPGPIYEIVEDLNKDGAPSRLMAYQTRHAEPSPFLRNHMREALGIVADQEFGEGNWDFEETMRSCPQHGWHCHARKRQHAR